jgi:GNAT superfamily N-acetyltransferase
MKQLLFFLFIFFSINSYSAIEIRPAHSEEIPAVLELDRKVTYEFFKPLFIDAYQYLGLKRDVDKELEKELALDAQLFSELAQAQGLERLHIAWDTMHNIPCGLIAFHLEDTEIILDILLVEAAYRAQKIGKRLLQSMFEVFSNAAKVTVYPLIYNNSSTLKFYEALGFKNLGVGPADKLNIHGIPYSKIYYHFELTLSKDMHFHEQQEATTQWCASRCIF